MDGIGISALIRGIRGEGLADRSFSFSRGSEIRNKAGFTADDADKHGWRTRTEAGVNTEGTEEIRITKPIYPTGD